MCLQTAREELFQNISDISDCTGHALLRGLHGMLLGKGTAKFVNEMVY